MDETDKKEGIKEKEGQCYRKTFLKKHGVRSFVSFFFFWSFVSLINLQFVPEQLEEAGRGIAEDWLQQINQQKENKV